MHMHVFVTGGTGYSGSHIVPERIAAGHAVTGLARSDTSAAALSALGAKVRRGDLQDLESSRMWPRTPTVSSTSHTGRTCCRPPGSPPPADGGTSTREP
jgi:nucleoside-diphosphate-sugar epimerase